MKILGLTGPSGAGKTFLSEYFCSRGVPVIDADKVYHELLVPPSECLDAIERAFGPSVLFPTGELDRAALGSLVFSDAQKLELLNKTVLSIVLKKIREILACLERDGHKTALVDAPTLIESGFERECDTVICVLSDRDARIERIMKRDNISYEAAERRVNAQKDNDFYASHSHFVIYNNGDTDALEASVRELALKLNL